MYVKYCKNLTRNKPFLVYVILQHWYSTGVLRYLMHAEMFAVVCLCLICGLQTTSQLNEENQKPKLTEDKSGHHWRTIWMGYRKSFNIPECALRVT